MAYLSNDWKTLCPADLATEAAWGCVNLKSVLCEFLLSGDSHFILSSPFDSRDFWFLFGWEYGEGLGRMQLSKHISLKAKRKRLKAQSIKQAQGSFVHDSGPFLLTSSSLVVFIFGQHLMNQAPG